MRLLFVLAALGMSALAFCADDGRSNGEIAKLVAKLVAKLGDDSWRVREEADKDLIELGPPALPELRKGLMSEDAEIRRRCVSIVATIEHREWWRATATTLNGKDLSAEKTIEEIGRAAGLDLRLMKPESAKDREIALALDKVSSLQALDKLCELADWHLQFLPTEAGAATLVSRNEYRPGRTCVDRSALGSVYHGASFGSIAGHGRETRVLSFHVAFDMIVEERIKLSTAYTPYIVWEATSDSGETLKGAHNPDVQAHNLRANTQTADLSRFTRHLGLTLVLPPFEKKAAKIAKLKLQVMPYMVKELSTVEIKDPAKGKSATLEGIEIKVTDLENSARGIHRLELTLDGRNGLLWERPQVDLLDKDGKVLYLSHVMKASAAENHREMALVYYSDDTPVKLRVSFPKKVTQNCYTFEFKDLELPKEFW